MTLVHSLCYYTLSVGWMRQVTFDGTKKSHIQVPVGIQVDVSNSYVKENAFRVWGLEQIFFKIVLNLCNKHRSHTGQHQFPP